MDTVISRRVKDAILAIEPSAEIVLYGSRARGDYNKFSDWDFRVLLDGDVGQQRTDRIRHELHEIEWDTGEVLCAIVRSRTMWKRPQYQVMPLSKSINLEGVTL